MKLVCCVHGCGNYIKVSLWRGIWAMVICLSPRPYVCKEHKNLFDGPGAP